MDEALEDVVIARTEMVGVVLLQCWRIAFPRDHCLAG